MATQTNSSNSSGDTGDKDVLKTLKEAVKGLTFPSESDKPVKAFLWKGGEEKSVGEAALKTGARVPAEAAVKTVPVEEFFAPVVTEQDWFGPEEKETAARFRRLVQALQERLTDLTVFRVEGAHPDKSRIDVYVVGRTPSGELAGVTTQLIET